MSVSMNPDSSGEGCSPTAQIAPSSIDNIDDASRIDDNSVLDEESRDMPLVGDLFSPENNSEATESKHKRTRARKPTKSKETRSKHKRENNGDGTGSSVEADTGDEVC